MEWADGKGPYIDVEDIELPEYARQTLEEMASAHSPFPFEDSIHDSHPPIYLDIDSDFDKTMLCGCPTKKALKEWFGEYYEELLKIGFRVAVYKTNNYIMGKSGKQLVFLP